MLPKRNKNQLKSSILNTAALVCLPLNVGLHLVLDRCCRTDCLKECTQYSELHFLVHFVNKLPCQPGVFYRTLSEHYSLITELLNLSCVANDIRSCISKQLSKW